MDESAGPSRELQSLVNALWQSLSYPTDLAQRFRLILSSQESLVLSPGTLFLVSQVALVRIVANHGC